MDEILIYRIIIGVLIVPILWLYFRRNNDSAVLEKEIEGLKKEKEGLENLKNTLTDSLEKERNTTKEQLKAPYPSTQ